MDWIQKFLIKRPFKDQQTSPMFVKAKIASSATKTGITIDMSDTSTFTINMSKIS